MTRPAELAPTTTPDPERRRVRRFELPVRLVHRSTAILMMTCIATAAVLYIPEFETLVGHRYLVELIHVYSGFAIPVPILLGLVSGAYRLDLRRLNRFAPHDWKWLFSRSRRDGTIAVGKFNAGQKLNALLSAGAILVLLLTGTLMYFIGLVQLPWRTGATFIHDWTALALGLLVFGHIYHANRDPDAMKGMKTGDVPLRWARRNHGAWAEQIAGPAPRSPDALPTTALPTAALPTAALPEDPSATEDQADATSS